MLNKFDKIVIKKGYSYNEAQVSVITKEMIEDSNEFTKAVLKLDNKNYFGYHDNAIKWEIGIDRHYIIQGFNKVITNNLNEYRVFFIDGKPTYIAWGDNMANQCVVDVEKSKNQFNYTIEHVDENDDYKLINMSEKYVDLMNNTNLEISKEVIKFSIKVFNDFIKYFWINKSTKYPIIFRIDISYADDPIFQDKHSIYLKNLDKTIRLYINEMEIDPTHFFYNNFICMNDRDVNTKVIQEKIGELIVNYIKESDN